MKLTNALKVLARHNISVTEQETTPANHNRWIEARCNGRVLSISSQGAEVSTMRVRSESDRDEMVSDYCAGTFWDTMPQVLRALGITS